jgi:hypothetical protein
LDSGEDLKINYVRPYPPGGDRDGRSKKRTPDDTEREEDEGAERDVPEGGDPEVKDGHIDTRVSPFRDGNLALKTRGFGVDN